MPTSPRYSLVSSEPSSSSDDLDSNEELRLKYPVDEHDQHLCTQCQRRCGNSSLSFWAIIVSLLSVCINCAIFLASSKLNEECVDPITSVTNENIHLLRRPSPFIGMDNITRPVPPVYREFVNFPQVIQQVDSEKPRFTFDDDPLRYMSSRGLVSPEERRVQVTDSVSTLFQFRTVDYGMEKCELHVHFPVNASTNSTSRPFLLSLHRLDSSLPLNTRTLSYSTKPRVTSTLTEIRVTPGSGQVVDWWQQFDCKWDQLLTFELACYAPDRLGGDSCWLEWWQERKGKDPNPAVYMKQISTI
ncbi:hypothetical protein VNI00_011456 [Paramarasmius palmivorus]|uniref:Ubiquitin 3 binding protein But2 C-terminal domain-containing protein n=1 Tax=Paramarasmius palmivorus TaxID=297713 RepID=A0AAW0CCI0_9AGAR